MPNKPIANWTLGEARDYCALRDDCQACELKDWYGCKLDHLPSHWDFTDAEPVEIAKYIEKGGDDE